MLQFSSKNGTASAPITVRALNDGGVLLDGEFQRRPIDCNASYITVQGVNAKNGSDTTVVVRGQHCTLQRVVGWAEQASDGGIENTLDVGGANNLIEDGGFFGFSRKQVACGARGGNGPNTLRRVWAEHNGSPTGSAQGEPTEVLELGYNQNRCTGENMVTRRNILSSASEPEAAFHAFSTHDSALLGSIGYVVAQDSYDTDILLNITPEAGSHVGSGHVTSRFLAQDVVLYAEHSHDRIRGYVIAGGNGSEGNVAKRIVAVAPQRSECGGSGWSCEEMYDGRTLAEALPGKTVWDTLPGICKRVVNRQITDVGLWPFPMTARIQAALDSARMPTRNVTQHVKNTLGEIPAKCLSGNTPIPPDPGPPAEVPVPPTAVQTAMQGTGVLVSWTDTVNTVQTGYTLERQVGSGAYVQISDAPGATARSYTDASPGKGQTNCYTVYARGAAGPSGLSPASCIAVPGTPVPPSGNVPIACEGMISPAGVVAMTCLPQASRR